MYILYTRLSTRFNGFGPWERIYYILFIYITSCHILHAYTGSDTGASSTDRFIMNRASRDRVASAGPEPDGSARVHTGQTDSVFNEMTIIYICIQ